MELYEKVSYEISRVMTLRYSTSFGSSTRLFPGEMRSHIYAIYGLVRVADEVVDTYRGEDADQVLKDLENEVYAALKRGYSTNPLIQSFVLTAMQFSITRTLIHPFFVSMMMDLKPVTLTEESYKTYIYGSAEVVGLMCLKVFVNGNQSVYKDLKLGASVLGSAYQKVNFLRDVKQDHDELGRVYFPGVTYETFSEAQKNQIEADIEREFALADEYIERLPKDCQAAVRLSYSYYNNLLSIIKRSTVDDIKSRRVRVPGYKKLSLFMLANISGRVRY